MKKHYVRQYPDGLRYIGAHLAKPFADALEIPDALLVDPADRYSLVLQGGALVVDAQRKADYLAKEAADEQVEVDFFTKRQDAVVAIRAMKSSPNPMTALEMDAAIRKIFDILGV